MWPIFKDLNSYLLAILFKVFFYVVLFGIILGVLEYYFFETNYFNDVVNNYPYSSSGVKKSFSGFHRPNPTQSAKSGSV